MFLLSYEVGIRYRKTPDPDRMVLILRLYLPELVNHLQEMGKQVLSGS
ncbi:MAG: hypothetical protein KAU23_03110 [Anaerolineales bacterium]|nr:hypothetical protein [Anaerolineales bacterium]